MSNVRAIVAGHGDFAAGMISAVRQITGLDDVFIAVTNRDLSAADVEAELREQLRLSNVRVVFTDLPAGSCTMATRRLQRERPGLTLVTGTNLTTLLDFIFQEAVPPSEAALHAAEKGRASLIVAGDEPRTLSHR
jgi:PTS system N-acetylgalactosamine-specific IIA component